MLRLNYFLNICLLLSFFVSLDIIPQSFTEKNILGYKTIELIPPGINPQYPKGLKYHTGILEMN